MDAEMLHSSSFDIISSLSEEDDHCKREEIITDFIKLMDGENKLTVNEFREDLEWFNVRDRLTLSKLKDKIVVLDFFTYCCINCIHVLPDLEELEKLFKSTDGVVVVGVHSAKFDNEKDSANILSAILRYNINHVVVNDYDATMWKHLQINCWPTFVVLGPDNNPLIALIGEGHRETLIDFVTVAVKYYGDKEKLSHDNIELSLHKDNIPPSPLLFPGKVSVTDDLIAVSDTGHNRILITNTFGVIQHEIGNGKSGHNDGSFNNSELNGPQGICWNKEGTVLYVADTDNHLIRQINVLDGTVETIAGTGTQGHDVEGGKIGAEQPICSPWDITLGHSIDSTQEDVLFVAMAGTHQVWMVFLEEGNWLKRKKYPKGTCIRFAGNGNEENRNNSYPHNAAFAQPSGICRGFLKIKDESVEHLFIADSESSTIRSVSLRDGSVKLVLGGDRDPKNLFAFGDVDGKGVDAKLQHPLGVAVRTTVQSELIVADSYNHKIKSVDLNTKECTTFNCNSELNEPGGICFHPKEDKLYIADTNTHKVKIYDFNTSMMSELPIIEAKVKESPSISSVDAKEPMFEPLKSIATKRSIHLTMGPVQACPGDSVHIEMNLDFEDGLHLTEGAPTAFQIISKEFNIPQYLKEDTHQKQLVKDIDETIEFHLTIPSTYGSKTIPIDVECVVYYCDDAGVCMMKSYVHDLQVNIVDQIPGKNPCIVKTTSIIGIRRDMH